MTRRRSLLLVALLLLTLGAAAALAVALRDDEDARGGTAADAIDACRPLVDDTGRRCLARELISLLDGADDPRGVVAAVETEAWRRGGFVLSNCHGVMHTVGRSYARDAGVTLGTLRDRLPASNDPACAAGFAHGVVTAVAPQLDVRDPSRAAAVCAEEPTRYRRYSCTHGLGHAFMRVHGGSLSPALGLCSAIGRDAPDCAQGAFHDYWFGVLGVDEATTGGEAVTDPRVLCGAQPAVYVRPCWYRAFVDHRPRGFAVESAADIRDLCLGLVDEQRSGCVTAASVIGPAEPSSQLGICHELDAVDAADCIRGTKVQNLLRQPPSSRTLLIRGCDAFALSVRETCYRWLGRTLSVITDGGFARSGCGELADEEEAWCRAGARSADEPLVTFS